MVKIEVVSGQPSQLHRKQKGIYEILFAVKNWQKDGDEIVEIENELVKYINKNFMKKQNTLEYCINANLYVQEKKKEGKKTVTYWKNLNWWCSAWNDYDNIGFTKAYIDSVDDIYVKQFLLYVQEKGNRNQFKSLFGAKDEHNDCVYNAICQAFNFDTDKLPRKINRPWKFKKHFGYERDDKVDLQAILPELQEMLKCSIELCGDIVYKPATIMTKHIILKCKNQHVTIVLKKRKFINYKEVAKENIYSYYYNDDDDVVVLKNNKTVIMDMDKFEKFKTPEYMLLFCNSEDELKPRVQEYIEKADYFKSHTNGMINYYLSQYSSSLAYDVWRKKTTILADPEDLTILEHSACYDANVGGTHYAEAGEYKDCVDCDMNVMYMHYMMQSAFTFPLKQGVEQSITTKELHSKSYFSYGLYYCKINGDSKFITNNLTGSFRWHTHFILSIAKQENMTIEMKEGQTNCILYSKERINGNVAFQEYAKFAFDLRDTVKDKYRTEAKEFTSCLWGFLCSATRKFKTFRKGEKIDLDEMDYETIKPNKSGGYTICYTKKVEKYKFGTARLGAFLTSYARLQLYNILKKNNIDFKNLMAINTDGFILQNQKLPDELIGSKPGMFKVARDKITGEPRIGTCVIRNSNSYKFI